MKGLLVSILFFNVIIGIPSFQTIQGQSIRKNFLEMTTYERDALIDAFYQLRTGPDLINDLATFHSDFFNFDNTADPTRLDIHFNLPDEPEREVFFAWHRQQMFEMEQAIQNINPEISLALWNSSINQSTTGPLWSQDWLGSFNTNWALNRNLGGNGPLPTPQDVSNLMLITDFFQFSNQTERQAVHRGAHVWVGGAMPTPLSPRDPVFYFHHSFVDKVWHDWEEIHHSSAYLRTSMLRYDGTYVFNGQTLPSVNPNDIIDTRSLGVFYAENGLAQLDNYIVSNTYRPEEVFYYQYVIEAGNNFVVPSGTSSRMVSVNEVRLVPGFSVQPGASFRAYIDTVNGISAKSGTRQRAYNPFAYDANINTPIVWEEGETATDKPLILTAFPNPFHDKITIKLNKKINCAIEVFNMMGMLVHTETFENTDNLEIHKLYGLAEGFYVIRVVDAYGNPLVIKRVVKL